MRPPAHFYHLAALVPLLPLLAGAIVASAAGLGCSAPAKGGGGICSSTGTCGAGLCVVGRCRPAGSSPAPSDTRRFVLPPREMTVLSSGESGNTATSSRGSEARALPEAIAIGREEGRGTIVLLRFSSTFRDDADVTGAFIVLDPIEGAPLARRPVAVEIARILDPWDSATASWGRQPRLSLPEKSAALRPRPSVPARIDVTRFVRDWAKRLPDDHGIALLIDGDDALGATYSMGISDGAGPRLEVYVR